MPKTREPIRETRFPKAPSRPPNAGTEVQFVGLIGRKHLNGNLGTVVPHINGSIEDATLRCRVQVNGSTQTVKVLARNIVEITPELRGQSLSLDTTESPSDAHLALPTFMKLNLDKGCEVPEPKPPEVKFSNRVCTSKGNQMLGETYAQIQTSSAGRDPGRLRHAGLDFFRDSVTEEAHPGNSKVRNYKTQKIDTCIHTMRSGYDWRGGGAYYVDPLHIPVAQGGHAAHVCLGAASQKDTKDTDAEGGLPMHPRLRGLLLNEELRPEEEYEPVNRAYRELLLFTNGTDYMRTRDIGGPLRAKAEKERDFKRKENNSTKLLKERAALSVQIVDERRSPPPMEWSGRTIEIAGSQPPQDMVKSVFAADDAQWSSLRAKPAQSPELHQQPPPAPKEMLPSGLLMRDSATDDFMNQMLQRSAEDADKGFDYGETGSTTQVPWYEQGELASSMLILDPNAGLPSSTVGEGELASAMLIRDTDARLPSSTIDDTTMGGIADALNRESS